MSCSCARCYFKGKNMYGNPACLAGKFSSPRFCVSLPNVIIFTSIATVIGSSSVLAISISQLRPLFRIFFFLKKKRKIGKQSFSQTDLEGLAGEFTFCKLHNVFIDLLLDRIEDNGDAILNGKVIDVKTTIYEKGLLACPVHKYERSIKVIDYFALMIGMFPDYEFKGFAKARDLLQDSRITDLGYGPVYAMRQDELFNKIEEHE